MVEKAHRLTKYLIRLLVGGILLFKISPAQGADQVSIISDVETQSYLAGVLKPLYQAAHLNFNENNIFLVITIYGLVNFFSSPSIKLKL